MREEEGETRRTEDSSQKNIPRWMSILVRNGRFSWLCSITIFSIYLSLSFSVSFSIFFTISLCLSLTHSLSLPLCLCLSLCPTLSLSLSLSFTLSHSLPHSLSLSLSHTLSLSPSHRCDRGGEAFYSHAAMLHSSERLDEAHTRCAFLLPCRPNPISL